MTKFLRVHVLGNWERKRERKERKDEPVVGHDGAGLHLAHSEHGLLASHLLQVFTPDKSDLSCPSWICVY